MANNTAEQMDNLLDAEGRRRRKDRPVVEKKRHPLETVPFFDRPMGASIKDVQVGEDDIGNPVFKTKLGDTYTVRLNPDQRTTRTKIEEDVLPAVKQYLQDPQLPTKEQVVGAGKAIAGAIKETVSTPKKLLTGEKSAADVTMGDVFDTAGMMAMGSIPFEVPEGSVRIFGGASAKKLDIKNFAKAEKLYEDGLDPEGIRKETGWFKDDVDRKWRFEIDDSKLKITGEDYPVDFSDSSGPDAWYNYVDEINENRLDDFSFGVGGSDGATLKLKDFLKHPKLYKHYPQLKDYTIEVGVDATDLDGAIGTFDPSTKTIQLSSQIQDIDELKDILVHEVQHAVQDIEGFLPGSNVDESVYLATSKFADEAKDISKTLKSYGYEVTEKNLDDYDFLRNASYHLQNQNPNLSDAQEYSALKYLKRLEDLGQRMGDVRAFRYHYYRNRSGEIEANLVEKRRSFDEEQRKLYSPISGKQGQITRPQAYRVADSVVQARQGQSDILLDTVDFDYVPSKDNPSRYVYQYKNKQSSNYGELYDEAIRDFLKSNKDTKKLASLKTGDTVTLNSDGREYFFVGFRPYSEMIRKLDKNYPHVFHEAMGERIEHDKVAGVTLVRIPRGTTRKQRKEIIKYIKNPPVETIDSPPSPVPENFTKFKEFSLGDLMFNSNKSKAKPEATASFRDASDTDSGFLDKFKFAKGGVTMKDQMEMAFMQEGGLKDDGMDIDPVSGNEVPPGSMAKEVRDDIPAQLSEGEYVVPADVVQYYGVKFFEDLRMEAKRGLADMEANGRIGGEPVDMPMDMPRDDTPTVAVSTGGYIDGIPAAEYNVGGMASNLYNNPTQMDQEVNNIISTMYNNPQVMDELARRGIQINRTQAQMMPQQMNQANPPSQARMGMNPGGLTSNEAAAYNYITSPTIPGPMFQTPGASYIYAAPPQMTTTAAGVDSSVPSVENCNKMGMDYDPIAKVCVPREVTQTPQTGGGDDDDGGPDLPEPKPWYDNVNWEDPTAQMNTFFGKEGKVGSAIAGVAGSVIGGPLVGGAMTFGAKVGNLAQSRAMVNVYKAMGLDDEAALIEKQIEDQLGGSKALSMADQTINKFVGSDGDIYTIQAFKAAGIDIPRGLRDDELQDYLDQIGEKDRRLLRNKYAPNYKAPAAKATATGPVKTSKDITSAEDIKQMQKDREEATKNITFGQTATKNLAGKDTATKTKIAESATKDLTPTEKEGGAALDTRFGITGLQKGGLMSKKKKKK